MANGEPVTDPNAERWPRLDQACRAAFGFLRRYCAEQAGAATSARAL